jgi:hypothetical protein
MNELFLKEHGVTLIGIATVFLLLTGCAAHVPVRPSFDTEPLVKKRSITVGIYYSKDLRDNMHVEELDLRIWEIPLGEASVSMFDRLFSSAFERVVDIKQWPPLNTDPPEMDVVIEPILESFSFKYPYDDSITLLLPLGSRQWEARIAYKLKLYTADGNVVGSHRIQGRGTKRVEAPINVSQTRQLAIAVERAIWDAAAQITVGIDTNDDIRHWLGTGSLMPFVVSTTAAVDTQEQIEVQDILAAFTVRDTTQEVDVIQCMMEHIGKANPSVKLMAGDEFNRKLFPWFEPSIAPDTPEKMVSLLSRPLVREKINALHIRYLVSITGGTIDHGLKKYLGGARCEAAGAFGYACIGLDRQERESNLAATVFDLQQAEIAGVAEASAEGTSWAAGVLLLPIWHTAQPDATACEILADKLADILQGDHDKASADPAESR